MPLSSAELYDQRREAIEKQNEQYLTIFEKWMRNETGGEGESKSARKKPLSDKVIRRHLSNLDLFLNWFLVDYVEHNYSEAGTGESDYGPAPMEEGMGEVGEFLGYFVIKKCLDSTPATIKSTAASIKKFYKCMLENKQFGSIAPKTESEFQEEYDDMVEHIKDRLKDWQADCAQYNDLDQPNPFAFF